LLSPPPLRTARESFDFHAPYPVNLVRLDVVLDQRVEELTNGNEHSDHELRRQY